MVQIEFGQSLQSADKVHSGSGGGSQLISISTLLFNVILESELNLSVLEALHTPVILKGDFSFRIWGMRLGELKFASFTWITNFDALGSMLLTR